MQKKSGGRRLFIIVLGLFLILSVFPAGNSNAIEKGEEGVFFQYLPFTANNFVKTSSNFGAHIDRLHSTTLRTKAEEAHLDYVRFAPFSWDVLEPVQTDPPTYLWNEVDEAGIAKIAAAGNILAVVLRAPEWARVYPESSCGAIRPSALDDYAAFLAALVTRYGQPPYNIKHWEIGNEPDIARQRAPESGAIGCWGDNHDPFYGGGVYGEMLKEIYPVVKAADPEAQIIVGGLIASCHPDFAGRCVSTLFLDGILEVGGGTAFDGVAFHAYDYYGGELGLYAHNGWYSASNTTGPVLVAKARYFRERLEAYGHGDKYLVASEIALLCYPGSDCENETHLNTHAFYVVQAYAAGLAQGLRINIWYSLREKWRSSGLLDTNDEPRPAYDALKFARTRLGNAVFLGDIQPEDLGGVAGVLGYKFMREGTEVWILWSSDGAPKSVTLPHTPWVTFDVFGAVSPGVQTLQVEIAPVIIEFW